MSRATLCIAFSSPDQLGDALSSEVPPLLARAADEQLEADVVLVGGGSIGNFENTGQLAELQKDLDGLTVNTTLVASFTDLPMLRFFPSVGLGEICRVEGATLEELVEVVRRVPVIQNIESVPSGPYQSHIKDCRATASYFLAMIKKEPDVDLKPLFTLAMFSKAVSLAWKTAGVSLNRVRNIILSVPGAEELGLVAALPIDGVAPSILSFIGCHLVDEDSRPGELRNPQVAEAAAAALERVLGHAERVHAVLKRSKLATLLHGHAPLVDAGPKEAFLKIIYARKIESMEATSAGFELKTSISKQWIENINDDLGSVLFALEQQSGGDEARAFRAVALGVAPKLAALTSISSPLFTIDSAALASSMADVLLSNKKFSVIAHSNTHVAHVVNQLQVRECAIDVSACALHVGKSSKALPSAISIFPQSKKPEPRPVVGSNFQEDVVSEHKKLQRVAKALDKPKSPIGSIVGTITAEFEFDGASKRAVVWRRRGGAEVAVSIHAAEILSLKFFDYASASIDGSAIGINKVENEFEISSKTKLRLNSVDPAARVFSFGGGGSPSDVELYIIETPGDRLSGLAVQWARREDTWLLTSDNSMNERLVV